MGSIRFTLESGGGILEKGDVTIEVGDTSVCDAVRGLGVTLAIAWPSRPFAWGLWLSQMSMTFVRFLSTSILAAPVPDLSGV